VATDALHIKELTVRYGGLTAVNKVSIGVEVGSFVGLIGPNGAGKTTLVDAVTGLVPSTGEVWFDGVRVDQKPAYQRSRTGLVRTFQSLELFEELTVSENLVAAADTSRWYSPMVDLLWPRASAEVKRRVDEALAIVNLTDVADVLVSDLALGQRKLVTIARALSMEPKVALLDEPAAGLASYETAQLGETLRRIVDKGTTILMIDHDMGLVLGVCDTVYVLEFGELIASGTPAAIRASDRVLHAYLGADDADELPTDVAR
jgi:ABC-type branched-subunit amino acid transport system ATPase component